MERQDIIKTMGVLNRAQPMLAAASMLGNEQVTAVWLDVKAELVRLRALHKETEPGPKELFVKEHVPLFHQLDGTYDCSNESCPNVGFLSAEDRELHYKMWEIKLPGR